MQQVRIPPFSLDFHLPSLALHQLPRPQNPLLCPHTQSIDSCRGCSSARAALKSTIEAERLLRSSWGKFFSTDSQNLLPLPPDPPPPSLSLLFSLASITMYSQPSDQDGQARQTPLFEPSPPLPPNSGPTSFDHDPTLYPEGSYAPYGWVRPTVLAASWEREPRLEEQRGDEMEEEGRRVSFADTLSFAQPGNRPFPSPLSLPFRPSWTDSQKVLCQPRRRTPTRRLTSSTCRTSPDLPNRFSPSLPFPLCLPCSLRLTLVCQRQVLPPVRRPTSSYTSFVLVPASSRPTDAELVRLRPREQLERLLSPSYVLRSSYLRQKD